MAQKNISPLFIGATSAGMHALLTTQISRCFVLGCKATLAKTIHLPDISGPNRTEPKEKFFCAGGCYQMAHSYREN